MYEQIGLAPWELYRIYSDANWNLRKYLSSELLLMFEVMKYIETLQNYHTSKH